MVLQVKIKGPHGQSHLLAPCHGSTAAKEHFKFQHEGCSAEVVLNDFLLGRWSLLQEVKPMFDTPQQGSARSVLTGLSGGYILGGVEGLGIEYLWVSGQHKLQRLQRSYILSRANFRNPKSPCPAELCSGVSCI